MYQVLFDGRQGCARIRLLMAYLDPPQRNAVEEKSTWRGQEQHNGLAQGCLTPRMACRQTVVCADDVGGRPGMEEAYLGEVILAERNDQGTEAFAVRL